MSDTRVDRVERKETRPTEKQKFSKVFRAWRGSVLFFAAIVVGTITVLAFNSHWLRIDTIEIVMSEASQEDLLFHRIRSTLLQQFAEFKGRYFWQVPLKKVYELTNRDRRVRKAAVYRIFPSRLRLEIEPHTPVLAFLATDGRLYPVATDATLLPAVQIRDAQDLPLLRGEYLRDEPVLREIAISLINTIPNEGVFRRARISEVIYSKKEGFSVFVSGASAEVKMGDSDFGPKVSRIEKVLSYLDSQNIKGRVIDARFSKKVVVRVRNTP